MKEQQQWEAAVRTIPGNEILAPVVKAAGEAMRWLRDCVPVESRPQTGYRKEPTEGNLSGWAQAAAAVRRLQNLLDCFESLPAVWNGHDEDENGAPEVWFAGLTMRQLLAVQGMRLTARSLSDWFSGHAPGAGAVLSAVPLEMLLHVEEAARVLTEAAASTEEKTIEKEYTRAVYSPAELRKLTGWSQNTLRKNLESQVLRNIRVNSRSYRVHEADLLEYQNRHECEEARKKKPKTQ